MAKEIPVSKFSETKETNPFLNLFLEKWQEISAPIRPSHKECSLYEKYIKEVAARNHNSKLLILGSTPELRDMAIRNDLVPVCCDHDIRV